MTDQRFNRPQRIVVVVALGVALDVIASWLTSWGSHLPYGSVTYSNLGSSVEIGGFHPWVKVTIWFIVIGLWSAISLAVLRSRSSDRDGGAHS